MRDGSFRGTTLIGFINKARSFIINADTRPELLACKRSPGRLGSELRLLLSSGGSQSSALTVPVCALQRTFLRHCLSVWNYTTETVFHENSMTIS